MKETLNTEQLLQLATYSAQPYFINNTTYNSNNFTSFVVLSDSTISKLTNTEGEDCITKYNLSGYLLPAGTVVVGEFEFTTITTNGKLQLCLTNKS